MQLARKRQTEKFKAQAATMVEDRLLDILTGPSAEDSRESFRDMLRDGSLDDQEIDVEVPQKNRNNDVSFNEGISNIVSMMMAHEQGSKKQTMKRVKLPIAKARQAILDLEIDKLLATVDLKKESISAVEESGIVFIDEIDKICGSRDFYRGDSKVSQEGVQRDLLPLIEGSVVPVQNFGNVKTDHILFICAGAFHNSKPSDLMPEFQGRLPVRVELKPLTEDDLYRIMTETEFNLILQQIEMFKTEKYSLSFEDEAIREIARLAWQVNNQVENIGARRLVTIIEKILEEINMDAPDSENRETVVTKEFVHLHVGEIMKKNDLQRFIL